MKPKQKHFLISRGEFQDEDSYFGLYAAEDKAEFAISSMLWDKLDHNGGSKIISVEFKALQEENQVCGDAQVSLFGNQHHGDSEIFLQNRLTLDSPFLLRFGTRQCGNMAYY